MQIILVIMHLRLCQICYHVCAYYSIIHSLTVVPEAISKQVNWNKSPCVVLIQEQCNRKTSPVCHQGNTNLQFSKQFSFEQHGCVWMGFSSVSLCSIATVMKPVIGGLIEGGAVGRVENVKILFSDVPPPLSWALTSTFTFCYIVCRSNRHLHHLRPPPLWSICLLLQLTAHWPGQPTTSQRAGRSSSVTLLFTH